MRGFLIARGGTVAKRELQCLGRKSGRVQGQAGEEAIGGGPAGGFYGERWRRSSNKQERIMSYASHNKTENDFSKT